MRDGGLYAEASLGGRRFPIPQDEDKFTDLIACCPIRGEIRHEDVIWNVWLDICDSHRKIQPQPWGSGWILYLVGNDTSASSEQGRAPAGVQNAVFVQKAEGWLGGYGNILAEKAQ